MYGVPVAAGQLDAHAPGLAAGLCGGQWVARPQRGSACSLARPRPAPCSPCSSAGKLSIIPSAQHRAQLEGVRSLAEVSAVAEAFLDAIKRGRCTGE